MRSNRTLLLATVCGAVIVSHTFGYEFASRLQTESTLRPDHTYFASAAGLIAPTAILAFLLLTVRYHADDFSMPRLMTLFGLQASLLMVQESLERMANPAAVIAQAPVAMSLLISLLVAWLLVIAIRTSQKIINWVVRKKARPRRISVSATFLSWIDDTFESNRYVFRTERDPPLTFRFN